jgi:putative nucleotidyltransferase with HDIG domain
VDFLTMDEKKETILFVDDEENILEIADEYFRQKGYTILTAKNGAEAVSILEREKGKIDCCFTDINMPEMDGLELAECIRKSDNTIPVIVMTGYPSLNNIIRTLKNGVVDFLIKPASLSQMEVSVRRVMRERQLFVENIILKEEVKKKEQLEKVSRELRSKVEELHILNSIMSEFSMIGSSSDLFDRLVEMAVEITCADEGKFYLVNDTVKIPFEAASALSHSLPDSENFRGGISREPEKRLIVDMISDRIPLLISEDCVSRLSPDIRSFMAVPLTIRGMLFGVLTVAVYDKCPASEPRVESEKHFTEKSLYYLSVMTRKAAYSIENLALYENIYENLFAVLLALVKALEAKDPDTGQHSKRVTDMAVVIAGEMGCSPEDVDILKVAGRLHDIGKIGIKDEILLKPGSLTSREFEKIKVHPVLGADIVGHLGLWEQERRIIRHHHERFDGTGYPDGLKKDEIPLLSRILSVADAYDAMAFDRIYRKKMEKRQVLERMENNAGSQFDPAIVKVFQKLYGNCFFLGRGERI